MDSGYKNYPQSAKYGHAAEDRFDRIRGNHIVRKATREEDMAHGWDRLDVEFGKVGIKGMAAVQRGWPPQDRLFPIEFINRDGKQPGWVFKPYDIQAYEVTEGFLMVPRTALLPFACGLTLTECGCVWVPRERLKGFEIVLDKG